MKLTITLVAFLLFATTYTTAQTKTIAYQEIKTGIGLFFGASMTTDSITITFAGPSTKWIGLGFGTKMGGSDALIYTSSGGTEDWWDYFMGSTSSNSVVKDAQQDWKFKSNTVANNLRTVVATRKLNTGDANDAVIKFSSTNLNLIWAKGATPGSYGLANHGSGSSNRGSGISLAWVLAPDVTPPTLITTPFTPADNAINIPTNTAFTVNFNEVIAAGSGSVSIFKSSQTLVEQIDILSNQIIISGNQLTIHPKNTLLDSTEYYIQISSSAIKDLSDNFYAGISSTSDWNFTTAAAKKSANLFEISENKIFQTTEKSVLIRANDSNYNYQIIDLQGNILRTKNNVQVDTFIDFTDFKPAIYFITFSNENQILKHKFVVQ